MTTIARRVASAAAVTHLALGLAVVAAGSAGATSISGSYAVMTAGSISTPASANDEPATVVWSLGQRGSRGTRGSAVPARLVRATRTPYVEPCDQGPGVPGGTTTISAIVSRRARFTFAMTVDAVRGRGTVVLLPSLFANGTVEETTVGCSSGGGSRIDSVGTGSALSILTTAPDPNHDNWPIRRSASGVWSLDETLTVPSSFPQFWPGTITAKLRLTGSLTSLRSSCAAPAATTLERLVGVDAGRAYLRRAGFRLGRVSRAYVQSVPEGHLYSPRAFFTQPCGAKLPLVVSRGFPPAAPDGAAAPRTPR